MIERISHYRIVTLIGRGAMGEVYRAIDDRLGRSVALKLLPAPVSGSTDLQARLLREAQAASALNHPGIVTVHDIGAWEGRVFMVMELVEGERLSDIARSGAPLADVLSLVAEVADALAAAHARSILHRDIKSDNLMRTRDGRAKVLDFGLAKLHGEKPGDPEVRTGPQAKLDTSDALAETIHPEAQRARPREEPIANALEPHERSKSPYPRSPGSSTETMAGAVFGTPAYMSPEQAAGGGVDACSEVFSLGIVLYELLTATIPFDGKTLDETLASIRTAPIVPPGKRAPSRKIPPAIDAVVLRALDRDRERRFPDMTTFAAALRATRARLVAPRRARVRWAIAAGVPLVLLTAGYGAYRGRQVHPTLGDERRLTFDPGCEEMPAFSADGRTLYYDSNAGGDYDIESVDLASGRHTQIARMPGMDFGVSASPTGHGLAWVHVGDHGDELMILDGAAPRSLGPVRGTPSWTREGEILMSPDGLRIDRVSVVSAARVTLATLSPDSTVFDIRAYEDGTPLVLWGATSSELHIGVVEQGEVRSIVDHLPSITTGIAISANQRGFYFTRKNGTAHKLVRHDRHGDDELIVPGVSPATLAVTRDGKALAFSTCEERHRIVRLGPDGVTRDFIGGGMSRDDHPVPLDAARTIFSSDRAGPSQIWMVDGASYRPLTGADTFLPAVSPDLRHLAWIDNRQGGLFVGNLDGSNARRLTAERADHSLTFMSDDKTLVFERASRVWAIPLDGGTARALTPTGSSSPTRGANPGQMLYVQTTGDTNRLVSFDLARGTSDVLAIQLAAGRLTSLVVSPDGTRAAFLRSNVELFEVALKDGATPVSRWKSTVEALDSFAYTPSGELLVSLMKWEGDLWLADASLP